MRPLPAPCGILLVRLETCPQRFRQSPAQRVRRKEEERTIFGSFGPKEGYGACFDDKQEKALPLFQRPGGHICPQCGQNGDSPLTLFRCGETGIDADSRKSP